MKAPNFKLVKGVFFGNLKEKENPQEVMSRAMDANLDIEVVSQSLDEEDTLYCKASFNYGETSA